MNGIKYVEVINLISWDPSRKNDGLYDETLTNTHGQEEGEKKSCYINSGKYL